MEGVLAEDAPSAPAVPTTGAIKSPKPRKPRAKASAAEPATPGTIKFGSNIHYDAQGRPLCSSSAKVCNARCINGYGFCKIHILEDNSAPFKRCEAIVNRGKECNWSVPINQEDNRFCAIHVSVAQRNANPPMTTAASEADLSTKSAATTTTVTKRQPRAERLEPEARLVDEVDLSSEEDDTPSYYSDLEGDEDIFPSYLFPPLSFTSNFALHDDSPSSSTFGDAPKLGEPNFDINTFLEQRSEKLLHLVKRYRLEIETLHRMHELHAQDLAIFRSRQLARLQNENSLLAADQERRQVTIEKLYKRKHQELQQRKTPHAESSHHDFAPSTTESPALALPQTSTPNKILTSTKGTPSASAAVKEKGAKSASSTPALPLTSYCYCHILSDPDQRLFVPCTYTSAEDGSRCNYPIIKYSDPELCAHHAEITAEASGTGTNPEEVEDLEEE